MNVPIGLQTISAVLESKPPAVATAVQRSRYCSCSGCNPSASEKAFACPGLWRVRFLLPLLLLPKHEANTLEHQKLLTFGHYLGGASHPLLPHDSLPSQRDRVSSCIIQFYRGTIITVETRQARRGLKRPEAVQSRLDVASFRPVTLERCCALRLSRRRHRYRLLDLDPQRLSWRQGGTVSGLSGRCG